MQRREAGIDAHAALELARRTRDEIARARIARVQALFGAARRALELIDRRETRALELERGIFAGLEARRVELVELEAQVIDARLALARIAAEREHGVIALLELGPRGLHRRDVGAAEQIQDLQVPRRIDEPLMLVLPR